MSAEIGVAIRPFFPDLLLKTSEDVREDFPKAFGIIMSILRFQ